MITVRRNNDVAENVEDGLRTFQPDTSTKRTEIEKNNLDKEASNELLSDAGKKIINQHIDSYIKNKTIEISTPAYDTFSMKATVSSLISVSETGKNDNNKAFFYYIPYFYSCTKFNT